MGNSIWEDWVLRCILIIGALVVGQLIEKALLYPDVAFFVRDGATFIFRAFQFDVIRVEIPGKGIGVQFNDYGHTTPEVEVVHALLGAGCIVFSLFLALATDYSFHNLKKFLKKVFNEGNFDVQAGVKILLKAILLILLFLPFTFFRFVIIIIIFLLIWDTILWPAHMTIAHDIIGNLILTVGTVIIYCYLMYKEYWKAQIEKNLEKIKELLTKSIKDKNQIRSD